MKPYTTLFLDIGGVLLSNGWDHHMREKAATLFQLDLTEMNARHALTFDTYEIGKISLDEYLTRVVFYTPRSFSREGFKQFMFAQSESVPAMIALIREVKERYQLKTVAVNNEGRELMWHRVRHFNLDTFIDFFVCSSFVHLRKPDQEIYTLALDLAQVPASSVIYIDDRQMLVEIARQLGIYSIQHQTVEKTREILFSLFPSYIY